jgi:hypothetical protein
MTKEPVSSPPVQGQQSLGTLRKIFSNPEGSPPFPVFVNAVDFVGIGPDVMLDLGVVTPESVNEASAKSVTPPVIDLHVIARFGMSLPTALILHQRLTAIFAQIPDKLKVGLDPLSEKEAVK